jgi:hypothetical protein
LLVPVNCAVTVPAWQIPFVAKIARTKTDRRNRGYTRLAFPRDLAALPGWAAKPRYGATIVPELISASDCGALRRGFSKEKACMH